MYGLRTPAALLPAMIALLASASAHAAALPVYADKGTENPFQYSFVATGGDVTAYYLGSGAVYNNSIGLIANGVTIASGVLTNRGSKVGTSFNFGSFSAGTALTFFLNVQQTGQTFYSNTSLNNDGANHVYSTSFSASGNIPGGTYIGFEDLSSIRSLAPLQRANVDYNYTDEQFSVTNIADSTSISAVPLPAAAPMFGAALLGLAGLGYAAKRKKADASA